MSTGAKKRGRKPREPRIGKIGTPEPGYLPMGTEVLLDRAQIAAALKVTPRRLDQLIAEGKYPAHDGLWQGRRRWRQSSHNAWVETVIAGTKEA